MCVCVGTQTCTVIHACGALRSSNHLYMKAHLEIKRRRAMAYWPSKCPWNRHRIAGRAKKSCFQKSLHNATSGTLIYIFSSRQHWPHYGGAKYSAANQLLRHVFSAFTILKRERMRGETEPVEVWRRHHEGARKTESKSCGLKLRKTDGCRVTPLVRAINR